MSMRTGDVAAALRNHALSVMNVSGLSIICASRLPRHRTTPDGRPPTGWTRATYATPSPPGTAIPNGFLSVSVERTAARKSVHQPPSSLVSTSVRFKCGADGRGQRVDRPRPTTSTVRIMGMPCVQQRSSASPLEAAFFSATPEASTGARRPAYVSNIRVVRIRMGPSKDTDT